MINNFYTPEHIQEKAVIDNFAKYVAKNGVEFEFMTKHKQQGNPMFSFLFGGRFSDYYRHKLEEERSLLENEEYSYQHNADNAISHSYTPSSNQFQHGYDFTQSEYFQNNDLLNSMKDTLENRKVSLHIMQEENYRLLSDCQQRMMTEPININKEKTVKSMSIVDTYRLSQAKKQCQENSIDYGSMEKCMEAILSSCTKDNICNGKNWVIEHCSKANNHYPLCIYLLARISISSIFSERLHMVYFINDLLHHCKRKNSSNLLEALESVIVPIYSLCVLLADEDGKTKLNKVLSLWETNNYTRKDLLDAMRENHMDPLTYLNNWYDNEINKMRQEEDEGMYRDVYIANEETISRVFSDARMKMANLEANFNQMKYELKMKEEPLQLEIYKLERDIQVYEMESNKIANEPPPHEYNCFQGNQNSDFQFIMPDISRPPPGFSAEFLPSDMMSEMNATNSTTIEPSFIEMDQMEEKNTIPYWRLPAALMVSQILLSQFDYKPVDSKEIKMPQLKPPSRRLIDISNTFYQLPSHDRPRDTEGWERLALHDFLKSKEKAKIGEIIDDFVSCLHLDKNEDDEYDYPGYEELGTDSVDYHHDYEDISDFRRNFPPPGTLNVDYRHGQSLPMSANFSPRVNSQRSLLGTPWDEYSPKQFSHNPDAVPSGRTFNYNNGSGNRVTPAQSSSNSSTSRLVTPKVVPLMSLGLPTNLKRQVGARSSKRGTFSRNSDEDSYSDRNRSRRRYSSRSRSRSMSRSRSQSTIYSRSRSNSYSRSRTNSISRSRSRSRSRSSQSSRGSDKRPYKGGFIARKRSRSLRKSRSLSRSPRPSYDTNYAPSNLMQNLPDRRQWSGMRSELPTPGPTSHMRQEDPFSRFRQQKSAGYSEWMKERVVRRGFEEEPVDNF